MCLRGNKARAVAVAALIVIVAYGAWLRSYGITWGTVIHQPSGRTIGLPWHSDEVDKLVGPARRLLLTGEVFRFERFVYPTLHAYLTAGTCKVASVAELEGVWIVARLISVLASVASIVLCYLIAARFSRAAGVVAAALLAVSLGPVVYARWANPEEPCTFFALLTLVFSLAAMARPSRRSFVLLGLALGFALSSKQLAVYLFPLPLAAYLLRDRSVVLPEEPESWRKTWGGVTRIALATSAVLLLLCAALGIMWRPHLLGLIKSCRENLALSYLLGLYVGAVLAGSLLCSVVGLIGRRDTRGARWVRSLVFKWRWPVLAILAAVLVMACFYIPQSLRSPRHFLYNIKYVLRSMGSQSYYGTARSDTGYFFDAIPRAIGVWAYVLSIAGVVVCLWQARLRRFGTMLLVYALPVLLMMERSAITSLRYAALTYPVLCVAAGVGVVALLQSRGVSRATKAFPVVILLMAVCSGVVRSHTTVRQYTMEGEPRIEAARWLQKHYPGAVVARGQYAAPVGSLDGNRSVGFGEAPQFVAITSLREAKWRYIGSLTDEDIKRDPERWWPGEPPSVEARATLRGVFRSGEYEPIRTFELTVGGWTHPFWLDMGMTYCPQICREVTIYAKKGRASRPDQAEPDGSPRPAHGLPEPDRR